MASTTVPKGKLALSLPGGLGGGLSPRPRVLSGHSEKTAKSDRDGKNLKSPRSPIDGGKSPRGKLPSALLVEDPSAHAQAGDANVGDRVHVGKFQLGKLLPKGVVRFRGDTMFAEGEWVGVELNEKEGKNDGSVAGVRYFTCKKGHGIFVRPNLVTKDSGSRSASPRPSPRPPKNADADPPAPSSSSARGRERAKSEFQEVTLESGSKVEVVKGRFVGKVGKAFGVHDARGETMVVVDTGNGLVSVRPHDCRALQEEASPLDVGNQVEFLGLNATIRYKGHLKTGTSDDVWVGMELKKPLGRSNGCFRGHQYFECKEGHALFAQAVTGTATADTPMLKLKRRLSRSSNKGGLMRRMSSLSGDDLILVEDQANFVLQCADHAVTSDRDLTEELEKKSQETLELQKKLQQLTDQEEELRTKVKEGREKQKAMLGQLYALPQETLKAFSMGEESDKSSERSSQRGSESASQASDDSEILDLSQFVDYDSW